MADNSPLTKDQLKAENDFLKMKMMLEHGASFGGSDGNELAPEIENIFLNNVLAFEKQFEEHKTILLFDKLGRPQHFKPAHEISDNDIGKCWQDLHDYLNEHGVDLDVCSPNISSRELYRFTIEELFQVETEDMDLPGWTTHFIYDEFHPDPVYDTTRAATDECINYILQKKPLEWTHHFSNHGLVFNGREDISVIELKNIVNRFKLAYDDLEVNEIAVNNCVVEDNLSTVTGHYALTALNGTSKDILSGRWKVILEMERDSGYWEIKQVHIEGINF